MIASEAAELIKATANAVLALYGIPEPPATTEIERITAALNQEAYMRRNMGSTIDYRDDFWTMV